MHNAIIIGSGLGGLVAAASLARAGVTVTVLERHHIPGGYATSFRRRLPDQFIYEFESSLHLLGNLDEGGYLRRIYEELGLFNKLEFMRADVLYRAVFPDSEYVISGNGIAPYLDMLSARYPEERNGLQELFDTLVRIQSEVMSLTSMRNAGVKADLLNEAHTYIQYQSMTFKELMDCFITSGQLKSVLGQQWLYYGLPPSRISAIYYACAWVEYHKYGGYYPKGRSQQISNALTEIIHDNGGEVLTGKVAAEILVEGGRAYGVTTSRGETFTADVVISNADPIHTFDRLVGMDKVPARYAKKIKNLKPSLSCFQVFLVLDCDFASVYGETVHEIVVNEYYDPDRAFEEIKDSQYGTMPYGIMIYELLNPDYQHQGRTTVSLFQLCVFDDWIGLDEDDYHAKKRSLMQMLINRFNDRYPGVKKHIIYSESSTPRTNLHYTGNLLGSIYGSAQTVDQSSHRRLSHSTPIEHLYLVGAWTIPGGGYSGVSQSGYNLARQLLLHRSDGGKSHAAEG